MCPSSFVKNSAKTIFALAAPAQRQSLDLVEAKLDCCWCREQLQREVPCYFRESQKELGTHVRKSVNAYRNREEQVQPDYLIAGPDQARLTGASLESGTLASLGFVARNRPQSLQVVRVVLPNSSW